MSTPTVGQPIRRREDARFLTGKGRYTDDISLPNQAYGYVLRSPHAHALVKKLDTTKAKAAAGVIAVFTGQDVAKLGSLPCGWVITNKDGSKMKEPPHAVLVQDRVRHVGDQVAFVVATTKAQAKAAAQLIDVDYEPLPAAANLAQATGPKAPQVWDQAPGNVCFDWQLGDEAAMKAAMAKAARVIELTVPNNRLVPNAIEPRAAIGDFDQATGELTLYTTSQNPHLTRLLLAAFVLGVPEHKVKVIAPDVGGGFGSKIFHYAEEVLAAWSAMQLGRPVKWTAERTESFMSDCHGRDVVMTARLGVDKDGNFLGLHIKNTANLGAYLSQFATATPTYLSGTLAAGVYKTPAIYVETRGIFTHTVPVDAYRGAGRPEMAYTLERLVDKAARELGMDRLELRRKNFITTFPYQTPVALQYDAGDYHATLDLALEKGDVKGYPARKAESAKRGKLRGIGFSTYVEACGIAPSAVVGALGGRVGLYESASVRVHPTGSISVMTGTHSHGQGHETAFAQIVADALGVPMAQVDIVHGDTSKISFGMGTYGSRSLSVGGSAIVKALEKIVDKGKKIAAHLLEASEGDVEFKDGKFSVKGTDRSKTFGEVALAAYIPHKFPIDKLEPGLEETAFYDPKNFTFPGGTHVIEVEIDPETGVVTVASVTAADDVGKVVNPLIVDGQMHGGLAQGIGQALFEEARFDETGQLLTASYMNYGMPKAQDFPMFKVGNHVTACTHNPLGAKGVGEVGAIGVPPAVINAVLDALAPVGVTDITMPATPEKVWQAIEQAKSKKA